MKILVAEDEALMLKTITIKLKKEGYEVIACADGKEALEGIEAYAPEMVLTDMNLPFASGLEIVTAAKKKTNNKAIVIVLSGMEMGVAVEEAFKVGANDYLTKPFSLVELVNRVKKFIP